MGIVFGQRLAFTGVRAGSVVVPVLVLRFRDVRSVIEHTAAAIVQYTTTLL